MNFNSIIQVDELAQRLHHEDLVIIDVRFNLKQTEWGREQYKKAHIPGAQYAHLDEDLSAPIINGVTGRHPWPSKEKVESLFSRLGINHDSQLVIYDQHHGGIAARFWAMSLFVGLKNSAVLNGGWQSWLSSEHERSSTIEQTTLTQFTASESLIQIVDIDSFGQYDCLIDARAAKRYRGEEEPIDPVAGHIPGALSLPFMDNLNEDFTWKTKTEIKARFEEFQSSKNLIYCGSGVTACHNLLGLRYAGYPLADIYGGSWSHYITDPNRPIATKSV